MSTQYMGVNTGELGQFGNDLRMSAGVVTTSAKRISDNMFGNASTDKGPDAGRAYGTQGKAIYSGLENVVKWLNDWGAAGGAIADTVGASAIVYSDTDKENASKTNNA
ncbi:hypothetical protein ACTD5D_36410 [Nocardia takedensis]|uniref:hypothetical protein n=1 Tax=Nocardia takedensis TaxID=259390 RepID=UPI0002E85E0E|nr:hypothetical protein [Nocardia takedensis]